MTILTVAQSQSILFVSEMNWQFCINNHENFEIYIIIWRLLEVLHGLDWIGRLVICNLWHLNEKSESVLLSWNFKLEENSV